MSSANDFPTSHTCLIQMKHDDKSENTAHLFSKLNAEPCFSPKVSKCKNEEDYINSSSTYFCSNDKDHVDMCKDKVSSDFQIVDFSVDEKKCCSNFNASDFENLHSIREIKLNNELSLDKLETKNKFIFVELNELPRIMKQLVGASLLKLDDSVERIDYGINNLFIDKNLKIFLINDKALPNSTDEDIEYYGFQAPETVLGTEQQDSITRVWTLGVIFLTLVIGVNPFAADSSILSLFKVFQYFGTPSSSHAKDLTNLPYYSRDFPAFISRTPLKAVESIINLKAETKFSEGDLLVQKLTFLISRMLNLERKQRISLEEVYNYLENQF